MQFRQAKREDIEIIQKLVAKGFEIPLPLARSFYGRKKLLKLFQEKLSYVLIDNINRKKIIGFIGGYRDREYGACIWIDLVVVDKTLHYKGIGTRLMNFFETIVKEKGFGQILLHTETINPGAMKFYLKFGYKKAGELDFMQPFKRAFFKKVINQKAVKKEIARYKKYF